LYRKRLKVVTVVNLKELDKDWFEDQKVVLTEIIIIALLLLLLRRRG
jgi:hypothetical protein